MTSLNRLLRTLSEQEQADTLRFRPQTEALEAREVPSATGPIELTKTVADMCYSPGSVATYHYVVTNDGAGSITQVSLTDDNGTPGNPSDDFTLTPGANVTAIDDNATPDYAYDDVIVTAGDRLFSGHSWSFQKDVVLPNVTTNTTVTNTAEVNGLLVFNDESMPVSATATATLQICVSTTTPPRPLAHGDTATIGFWNNKNGQALINSLNGGPNATNLATWLATNFPHLYGAQSANDLTGKTNAAVAALFQKDFSVKGAKTDAQILAGALAVYVTDFDLAGGAAVKYGFNVTTTGTGEKTYNVGSLGTAIGLKNNTTYTVLQLLQQADLDKTNGTYNANAFNSIFDGINQKGDIS